ncbi:MAG: hypothetical protein JSV33_08170 [bacterium]|nr:MAG: hypothetical protein JSV33_08170 [bacterium]
MNEQAVPSTLCIFEDERFPNFFPLSLDNPVFDLRIGTLTVLGRLLAELTPERLILLHRPYLAGCRMADSRKAENEIELIANDMHEGEVIFLNGRLLTFGDELRELLAGLTPGTIIHKKGVTVAASLSGDQMQSFYGYLSTPLSDEEMQRIVQGIKEMAVPTGKKKKGLNDSEGEGSREETLTGWAEQHGCSLVPTEVRLLSHYWQLIGENPACIIDDFKKNPLRGTAPEANLFKGVDLINEEDIVIGSDVEVRSGTVLDASEGPIIIADRVRIEPNAIVYGPCYIGDGSIIRGGAKIGHGTSIGTQCRIGGEVEETLVASYSNKQHEGFLGHSYVGSWTNLGAGSCNSDLKNNYSIVRAWSKGVVRETGRRFLGAVIADHAKLAINTRLNTGTVVGFNANVLSTGFPPKFVPSFTWSLEPEYVEYELDKAIETAKIMMDRRNIPFSNELGELFKTLYRFCRQSGHTI